MEDESIPHGQLAADVLERLAAVSNVRRRHVVRSQRR
jgi:hypothetical protein